MGAVGRHRHRTHLIGRAVAGRRRSRRRPGLSVVRGKNHIGHGGPAVSNAGYHIGIVFSEVEAIGIGKGGIAIHTGRGGLGQIGVAHPSDVPESAEENSARRRRVDGQDRGFLKAVILEGPSDSRGLSSGSDIGTVPNPAARRVNSVGRIKRINSYVALPTHSSCVSPAKKCPLGRVDVVIGEGARVPARVHVANDRPGTAAIGGAINVVGPAPPVEGCNH